MSRFVIGTSNAEARISSEGGTVEKFAVENFVGKKINILFPLRFIAALGKTRGGIPICLPFFGPAPEKFAEEISQHGFLRNQELKVVEVSNRSVTLGGTNKYRKTYPWSLEYKVTIEIGAMDELVIKLQVKRLKDGIGTDAPINMAFHPYFRNRNTGEREVTVGDKVINNFNKETLIIPADKKMTIYNGYREIEMLLDGDFNDDSCVALWSDSDEYFCVEPILTHPDDFDTPKGKYLKQEEEITLICIIKPL